jgi:hypothetical protein
MLVEICAGSFSIIDETSVNITILTRCCTRIQDIPSACTSLQIESIQQVSAVHSSCWESVWRVSVHILSADVNLSRSSLLTKSRIMHLEKMRDYEHCLCILWCNYYSAGRTALGLVKGLLFTLLKDVQLEWRRRAMESLHLGSAGQLRTIVCSPCSKGIHYDWYFSPFYMDP